jgi:protein-L-isoaspartate O-methyltransferase
MDTDTTFKDNLMNSLTNLLWRGIDILAENFPIVATRYYQKIIGSEYQREYQQFNILPTDTILHIGCGTYPLTEMVLRSTCNPKKIQGIDNRIRATNIAQKYIATQDNDQNITIDYGDGKQYDFHGFSTIIISSCATPKTPILQHLIKNASSQTKIILREVETAAPTIYSYLKQQKNIIIQDSLTHHPFPFVKPFGWISYLIIKE